MVQFRIIIFDFSRHSNWRGVKLLEIDNVDIMYKFHHFYRFIYSLCDTFIIYLYYIKETNSIQNN